MSGGNLRGKANHHIPIQKILILIFFPLLIFITSPSYAKYKYIFDFDGTLVDDGRLESSWKTPWVLKKVDQLSSSTQINKALRAMPDTIEVSFAEYINLLSQGLWANGNGSLGSYSEVSLPQDPFLTRPKNIIPGYYHVDSETFKFYRTDLSGIDYPLKNYIEAKERIKRFRLNSLDFSGPAFNVFQQAMSETSTVGDVHIFTARDQGLHLLFEELQKDKLINHVTGINKRGLAVMPIVHNLQGPESILYGRTLVEGKREVLRRLAINWAMNTADLTTDYAAHDPSQLVETHTIIVAEDDPSNILGVGRLMSELSQEHTTRKLKFVLFNTANEVVIGNSMPPFNKRWMVFDQGSIRHATEKEIQNYTGQAPLKAKSIFSNSANSCDGYLKGGY